MSPFGVHLSTLIPWKNGPAFLLIPEVIYNGDDVREGRDDDRDQVAGAAAIPGFHDDGLFARSGVNIETSVADGVRWMSLDDTLMRVVS